jgi:hypothetical protein
MNTDEILNKLDSIGSENNRDIWENWSLEEKEKLLRVYLSFCKKESHLFDLINSLHNCDNWERIFKFYNEKELREKSNGVNIAIQGLYIYGTGEKDEKLK